MKRTEIENRLKDFLDHQEPPVVNRKEKENVWRRIQNETQKKSLVVPMSWYLAAASLALLVVSIVSVYQLTQRDAAISKLQSELEEMRDHREQLVNNNLVLKEELITVTNRPRPTDTVYLTRVVYKTPEVDKTETTDKEVEAIASEGTESLQSTSSEQKMPVLANLQSDVESLEIDYGETTTEGITPWRFTVKYH